MTEETSRENDADAADGAEDAEAAQARAAKQTEATDKPADQIDPDAPIAASYEEAVREGERRGYMRVQHGEERPDTITGAVKRTADAGNEGVYERGYASKEYIEGIEKGFIGLNVDPIPDDAFTIQGVTSDPTVAAESGRVFNPDIHDKALDEEARRENAGRKGSGRKSTRRKVEKKD